jgi:hypothetical protein
MAAVLLIMIALWATSAALGVRGRETPLVRMYRLSTPWFVVVQVLMAAWVAALWVEIVRSVVRRFDSWSDRKHFRVVAIVWAALFVFYVVAPVRPPPRATDSRLVPPAGVCGPSICSTRGSGSSGTLAILASLQEPAAVRGRLGRRMGDDSFR